MADIMRGGLTGSFNNFKSASEGLMIALGEQLAPTFSAILETLTKLARWVTTAVIPAFAALPGPVKKVAIGLGLVLAALGPIALAGGGAIAMIGKMVTTLTTMIPVLAGVKLGAIAMWGSITLGVSVALAALWMFRKHVGDALSWVILKMADFATWMIEKADLAFGWIPRHWRPPRKDEGDHRQLVGIRGGLDGLVG